MIDLIGSMGETILVHRNASGEWVNGRWLAVSPSTISIDAVVLPMSAQELTNQIQMGGIADRDAITIYSIAELFESSEDTEKTRDIVEWRGNRYSVTSVSYRYQLDGLEHYKSIGKLENS